MNLANPVRYENHKKTNMRGFQDQVSVSVKPLVFANLKTILIGEQGGRSSQILFIMQVKGKLVEKLKSEIVHLKELCFEPPRCTI